MTRLMLRTLLPMTALLLLAAPAAAEQRRFSIADFDRIVVEGPFTVRLVTGRTTRASATGSAQAIDGVSIEGLGQTLRIRRNPNAWSTTPGRAAEPAIVTIATRSLRSARVVGTGSLDITGARAMRLDLVVEGSGRMRVTGIAADTLSLGLRGAGTLDLQGTTETLTADIQGSGTLAGERLSAETATLAAATSGDVTIAARRTATVTASGVGRVTIGGTAACTLRGPSAANVRCARVN